MNVRCSVVVLLAVLVAQISAANVTKEVSDYGPIDINGTRYITCNWAQSSNARREECAKYVGHQRIDCYKAEVNPDQPKDKIEAYCRCGPAFLFGHNSSLEQYCFTEDCIKGPNQCATLNPIGYITIILTALALLFVNCAWCSFLYFLISLVKNKLFKLDAMCIVTVFGLLGLSFMHLWVVSYLVEAGTGSDAFYTNVGHWGVAGSGFLLVAALTISLMWRQVALASKSLRKTGATLGKGPNIAVGIASVTLILLLLIINIVMPRSIPVLGLTVAFLAGVGITYKVGAAKLTKQIDQGGTVNEKGKKLRSPKVHDILRTARIMYWNCAFFVLAAIVTVVMRLLKKHTLGPAFVEIFLYAICIQGTVGLMANVLAQYLLRSTRKKRGFKVNDATASGTTAASTTTVSA